MSFVAGCLAIALFTTLFPLSQVKYAEGAYSTSTTDADGNTHLLSNTVNDTTYYDRTKDSSEASLQQQGIDPNWANGVVRESYGLKFDGSNDYVTIADSTTLSPGTGDYTIELWFKTSVDCTANTCHIFSNYGTGGTNRASVEIGTNNQLSCTYRDGSSNQASATVATNYRDNTWHYTACVKRGKTAALYVDGSQVGTSSNASMGSVNTAGIAKAIGTSAQALSTQIYTGYIDEVRVSNIARYSNSTNPVIRRFKEDANTVALYHFDEGTSTTLADASQYANTGTLMNGSGNSPAADGTANGPIWVTGANAVMDGFAGCNPDAITQDANCTTGNRTGAGNITIGSTSSTTNDKAYEARITGSNGVSFDGGVSDSLPDYINIPSSSNYDTATGTWEFWFKTDRNWGVDNASAGAGTKGTSCLMERGDSSGSVNGISLCITSVGTPLVNIKNGTTVVDAAMGAAINSTDYADSRWHHYAMTFSQANGGTDQVFLDGVLIKTYTNASSWTFNSQALRIAVPNSNFWEEYEGTIDEVRISSSARYIANFSPARRFATDGSTVGLWHLDEGTSTTTADFSGNGNTGTFLNSSGNSPAADGSTNGPLWVEGIASTNNTGDTTTVGGAGQNDSSLNWALKGYQNRKRINIATTTALGSGHAVETTQDRSAIIDNKQSRSDGNDWRVMYQPSDKYRSLSFDGSNDVVTIQDSTSLSPGTGDYTVEAWFKTSANFASTAWIFSNYGSATNNQVGLTINTSNKLACTYRDGSANSASTSSTGTINDGQWHSAACVKDSTTVRLYLDGKQNGTASAASVGAIDTTGRVKKLGQIGTGTSEHFTGSIDEVRVSNVARYKGGPYTPSREALAIDSNTKALWHLDAASGQIVRDMSSNENNGTLGADSASASDDPTWLTGATADGAVSTVQEIPRFVPHGHAIYLDGPTSSSYVTAANASSINFGSGSFTVEAWIRPDDNTTGRRLMNKSTGSVTNGWLLDVNNGVGGTACTGCIRIKLGDGTHTVDYATSTNQISANVWQHIALVVDRTTQVARIYLNGTQVGSTSVSTIGSVDATGSSLGLGVLPQNLGSYYKGSVDEVRLSNTVRYRNNFTTTISPFAKDTSTALLWHLDDGSGTAPADNSGNSNTGSFTNTPTWVTNGGKVDSTNQTQFKIVAPIGASTTDKDYYLYYGNLNEISSGNSYNSYGVLFDGSNDYITVPDNTSLKPTSAITVSAWFNTSDKTLNQRIISKTETGSYSMSLNENSACPASTLCFAIFVSGAYRVASLSTTSLSNNTWYHAVGTYDGTTVTLYLNGASVGTSSFSGTITNSTAPFCIGSEPNATICSVGTYFKGQIDDVRVYARSLSTTEVTALYANTPTVSNISLVGWWKLDDTTAAGTTATDSSSTANNGTLTNFNFNGSSNWTVHTNLLGVTTEPTQSVIETGTETPIFYQWKQTGGSWSTRAQIPTTEAQLGSEGVYLRFNPAGIYSRNDYYLIPSWAVEAFSTSSRKRGKRRSFPLRANVIATASGIDIIDADTNKVWMSFTGATNNMLGSNQPLQVYALNGRIYVASADGLTAIQFGRDTALRWTSSGNSVYTSGNTIADRNDAAGYGSAAGSALVSTTINDVSAAVIGTAPPKIYVAVATSAGMSVVANATSFDANNNAPSDTSIYDYSSDAYTDVALTDGGELYGANSTAGGLDRYDNVHSDSADQTTTADVTYTTSSTPALRSNTVNDISVTTATSIADNGTSNEVAVAHNLGVDLIDEHSTQATGQIRYFAKEGSVGTSGWNNKLFGGALSFDGVDDYASVTSASTVDFAFNADFTVEFWGKFPASQTDTTATLNRIIAKWAGTGGFPYEIKINNQTAGGSAGKISAQRSDGTNQPSVTSSVTVNDNAWHHIAFVKNSSTLTIYIDGASSGTTTDTTTGTTTNSTALTFGRSLTTLGRWTNGTIDEVRISSAVRYTSAFTPPRAPFTTDASTGGLWHFDGRNTSPGRTASQTAFDESTNANNATLGATTAVASDDPTRIIPALGGSADKATAVGLKKATFNNAASFTAASTEYLSVTSNSSLQTGGGSFTIAGWVNMSDKSAFRYLISKFASGNSGEFYLYYQQSTDLFRFVVANGTTGSSIADVQLGSPSINTWYYLVAWYDSSTSKVYIQANNDVPSSASAVTPVSTSDDFRIGGLPGIGWHQGKIDNVAYWKRILTPAERAQLYNGGAGFNFENIPSTLTSNLVSWWSLDEPSTGTAAVTRRDSYSTNNLTDNNTVASATGTVGTGSSLWVGTNDSSANDGAVTDVSLETDKQIVAWTTSNSGLPDNDVNSLSLGSGGLALVGTNDAGAWNPGLAGNVVDDTASSPATAVNPIRAKSGGMRIKGGTVRFGIGP